MFTLEVLRPIYEWFTAEHWLWSVWGFLAAALFAGRFVLQWFVSERLGKSVIPVHFWYLSFCGGIMYTIYALHVAKWPIILMALPTPFIAWRNLHLIRKHAEREASNAQSEAEGTQILEKSAEEDLAPMESVASR